MYADLRNTQANVPPLAATGVGHQAAVAPSRPLRENHPYINYWTEKSWTTYKSRIRQGHLAPTADPGALDFIESDDGIPVSVDRIKIIRRTSRELFTSIRAKWEESGRSAPDSWGKMSHGNKLFYREKMKEQYPELGLCEDDWKCEFLATQSYPGWHRNHGRSVEDVKVEPGANAKKRSKRTVSSKSPTPAPNSIPRQSPLPPPSAPALDDVPGWTHPRPVPTPSIPVSSSELYLNEPLGDPTMSPVVSTPNPEPHLDSNIVRETNHGMAPQAHQDPSSTLSPSFPSLSPQSPRPVSTTLMVSPSPTLPTATGMPLDISPFRNQSPDITPPPDVHEEAMSPDTPIGSLQGEIIPGGPIHVRLQSRAVPSFPADSTSPHLGRQSLVRRRAVTV